MSDEPYLARVTGQIDPSPVLRNYDVLGKPDAVVEIRSPVESFLDRLMTLPNATLIEPVGDETILVSLLGEHVEDVSHAGHILSNTFAAYHARHRFDVHTPTLLNNRILEVKRALQEQTGAPEWMNRVAMRAGVDYHRAWLMYSSFLESGVRSVDRFASSGVVDWLQSFFDTMSHMPPREISLYLPDQSIKRVDVLTRMRDVVSHQINVGSVPWQRPADWHDLWRNLMGIVLLYMRGAPYSEIAHAYLEKPMTEINNRRTKGDHPVPAVFKFLSDIVNRLAIDAGCFLAIVEQAVYDPNATSVPEALQALPLCIRNGCDSLGTLTWYRFGYRQRSCAHAFQRAFPVPDDLTADSDRIGWVQQTRRRWLAGDLDATGEPLMHYARTVITAA